jgi:hypothetical protein
MTQASIPGAKRATGDDEILQFVRLCMDLDWRNSESEFRAVLEQQLGWQPAADLTLTTPSGAEAGLLSDEESTDQIELVHTSWLDDATEDQIDDRIDAVCDLIEPEFNREGEQGDTFDGEIGIYWILDNGTKVWVTEHAVLAASPKLAEMERLLEENPEAFDDLDLDLDLDLDD